MSSSRRLALIALAVVLPLSHVSVVIAQLAPPKTAPAGKTAPAAKTVVLVVDYGDGVQKHFRQIPWKKEMTVFDAMQAAARHSRGIRFEHRGSGGRALLIKIDDLSNEGGGGKNWIFRVNGRLGDRSFGVAGLRQNDTVLWKFGKYK